MKKIPTLFVRDMTTRLVTPEVTAGCEWVLAGEGVATIKYDGSCCMVRDGKLYARYQAKTAPSPEYAALIGFIPSQDDGEEGHRHGWRLVDSSPNDQYHREAWDSQIGALFDWTYELVGPKLQKNPYGLTQHRLYKHGIPIHALAVPDRTFDGLRAWLENVSTEGIVWWRDLGDQDCEKAKVKRKDFSLDWPVKL